MSVDPSFPEGRDGSLSRPPDGRPGGASLPKRKWLGHAVPAWVNHGIFFVTINCRERGGRLLIAGGVSETIQNAATFYHGRRWWVHLWLIMPDHIHALLSFPQTEEMRKVVGDWKRFVAGKTGIEWQKGFFDHRLRRDETFEERAFYIRMNPVRAGIVATPEEWPFVLAWNGRDGSPSRPGNGRPGSCCVAKAAFADFAEQQGASLPGVGDGRPGGAEPTRRVYVDFDDILSETALGFAATLETLFGKRVAFEDIFSFDLGRSFGLSPEDTAELMCRMHTSEALLGLRPVPGARDGLRTWKEVGCEVHVVTGRPPATRPASEEWLQLHDMQYDELFFVDKYARNHPPHAEEQAITLDQLRAMRFCLAVEDSPVMIRFFAQEMDAPLVILDRPWNRQEAEEGRVTRCRDWCEILRRFPRPAG